MPVTERSDASSSSAGSIRRRALSRSRVRKYRALDSSERSRLRADAATALGLSSVGDAVAVRHGEYSATVRWNDRRDPDDGPDWYYVRVTQHNGHVAWSSPVWVG